MLAGDQVSKLLHYSPVTRVTALGALTHPFFDELRDPNTALPNGEPQNPMFFFLSQSPNKSLMVLLAQCRLHYLVLSLRSVTVPGLFVSDFVSAQQ